MTHRKLEVLALVKFMENGKYFTPQIYFIEILLFMWKQARVICPFSNKKRATPPQEKLSGPFWFDVVLVSGCQNDVKEQQRGQFTYKLSLSQNI